MVMLGKPVDKSDVEGQIFVSQPVDNLNEYDLEGTEMYRSTEGELKYMVLRWFLVSIDTLESGNCEVEVEVYDQQTVNPFMHSTAGPVSNIEKQSIKNSFEKPEYETIGLWVQDDIETWLTEWDEENPPADHLLPGASTERWS